MRGLLRGIQFHKPIGKPAKWHRIVFLFFYFFEEAKEFGVRVGCQSLRLVKFDNLSIRKHHHFVRLHDSVQAMSNRDHGTAL